MVKALLKNKLVSRLSALWAQFSLFKIFIKYPFFLIIFIMLILGITYGVLLVLIDGDFIKQKLTLLVQEKAGIKAEFGNVEFSLNYGLAAKNIKLYAPDPDSVSAKTESYQYPAKPFFQADELKVRYDLPSVLIGQFSLSEFVMINPSISITKSSAGLSLDGIIRHLEKNRDTTNMTPPEDVSGGEKADTLLPIHPRHIYLPLGIALQNMGIENLAIEFNELSEKTAESGRMFQLAGLSFKSQLTFKGNKSSLDWKLSSEPDHGLRLIFDDPVTLNKPVTVISDFDFTGHLENLMSVQLSLNHKLRPVTGPLISVPELKTSFSMKGHLTDDLRGVRLADLSLSVGDLLHYKLSGILTLMSSGFETFHLDLESNFISSLKELSLLAQKIVALSDPGLAQGLSADGYLELEKLRINGVIDLKAIKSIDSKNNLQGTDLPNVSVKMSLNQISAQIPARGLSMSPLDGKIAISMSPSLNGEGSQLDFYQNLFLEGLHVEARTPQGLLNGGVRNLSAKSLLRADWPSLELPLIRTQVDAPVISLEVNGKKTLEIPFSLYQQASVGPGLEDGRVNLQLESGNLMSVSLSGHCDIRCKNLGLLSYFKLNSLKKLHQLILPFAKILGKDSLLPAYLDGSLSAQIDVKGSLPNLKTPDSLMILNEGAIRFQNQFNLEQLSLKDPGKGVEIKDLDLNVKLSGDLRNQSLKINNRVALLTANLPGKNRKSSDLKIERLNLNTQIENKIIGPLTDLKNPVNILKHLVTDHESDLYWNHFSVSPDIPVPISDFNLKIKNSLDRGSGVILDHLKVDIPGLGIKFASGIHAHYRDSVLTNEFPGSFKGNVSILVDHSGIESVPVPIKTSGKFKMNLDFSSKDFKSVFLNGDLGFHHFNLSLFKGEGTEKKAVVLTENISGKIPFNRTVDIEPFLKKPPQKPSERDPIKEPVQNKQKLAQKDLNSALERYTNKNQKYRQSRSNAMSLADYTQLRPFYPSKKPIYIEKIEVANLSLEDIEFDIDLSQNWFSLNQFMMNFLGGRVQGTLRLGFEEMVPHTLKATLHLTRLNTHKLLDRFPDLQNKSDSGLLSADPWLDASVHLNYNMLDQDISGGIDITSIGKEQLKMILFYVDPEEKDPSIEKIKLALKFGEVDQVKIPIKNSEIDIDVGVNFLVGIPFPVPKITRLPLATLLGNVLKTSESGQKKSAKVRGENDKKNIPADG